MINSDLNRELLRIAARSHFWAFCCYFDYDFFAVKRRFLKEVALAFQEVIDEYEKGNSISISVSTPPRAGKSYITSLFAAYWLCRFPHLSVMRNTCTTTLYQKFSYDTRAIMRTEKRKEVFPEIELSEDKQNIDGWNLKTSKQVGYFGSGVGGTIIGFGANIAITDDLYKSMMDALSSTTQAKAESWKQSAHDSRKERNCPEIFIGTRWTKNDIIGKAIDSGDLARTIIIPALINDKSFCEDVKTTKEYLKIKSRIEKSIWSAEYMQQPYDVEGILLPASKLNYFNSIADIPKESIVWRFTISDPANKGGDKYSNPFIYVCMINDRVACYVVDAIHSTDGIEANTERIPLKAKELGMEAIFLEDNGIGLAAALLIKKKLPANVKFAPFHSSINKETRILSNYEFVRDFFYFQREPEQGSEYASFMYDMTNYQKEGDNKHRLDAIDVICSAANFVKLKFHKVIYGQ